MVRRTTTRTHPHLAVRRPRSLTSGSANSVPIVFANAAFSEMTAYVPGELIGRNCRFLQRPETDPDTVSAIRAALKDRTNSSVEILNYRKDGTPLWNALFISPVFDAEGRLLYHYGNQLDISRRRDAEAALRQAQKMEAVGQRTGGIAQDLNNLPTVIGGNLDLVANARDDAARQRYLGRTRQAVASAQGLTAQLLASRASSGSTAGR